MKKWNTLHDMAMEITEIDTNESDREFSIAKCSQISSKIIKLYKSGGKSKVLRKLRYSLPLNIKSEKTGYYSREIDRIQVITEDLFKYNWFPLSRIRCNMRRLTKKR